MRKQKILFDMDGCKADFLGGILSHLNLEFPGLGLEKAMIVRWGYFENHPDQRFSQVMLECMKSPNFFLNLDPIAGAIKAFNHLVQLGHEVYPCTAPLPVEWPEARAYSIAAKIKWVEKYLGKEVSKSIIFSDEKVDITADVIIDDKPTLTLEKLEVNFRHWLIVDHPYNQNLPESLTLFPIGRINNDWSNYEEEFEKLGLL